MPPKQRHGSGCYCFSCTEKWTRREAARRERERQQQERDRERAARRSRQPYNPALASPHIKAVYNPTTGTTDNYFGGYDQEGDGKWHGHATVDETGEIANEDGGRPAGEKP